MNDVVYIPKDSTQDGYYHLVEEVSEESSPLLDTGGEILTTQEKSPPSRVFLVGRYETFDKGSWKADSRLRIKVFLPNASTLINSSCIYGDDPRDGFSLKIERWALEVVDRILEEEQQAEQTDETELDYVLGRQPA